MKYCTSLSRVDKVALQQLCFVTVQGILFSYPVCKAELCVKFRATSRASVNRFLYSNVAIFFKNNSPEIPQISSSTIGNSQVASFGDLSQLAVAPSHATRTHFLLLLVGLTPTGVQRPETRSLARLISRSDRGRQPTYGCGPPSRCAQIKGGEGLGDEDT
jgi:hypothetical protein